MGTAASSQHSVTSTDVEDLWLEILKRLPVKSLCKFRCVCKSWNSLFSSTFFITFHHNFMVSEMPTNHKSYFMVDQLDRPNIPGYAVYHPHQRHAGSECITNIGLPFPVQKHWVFRNFNVVDVIHGVACLVEAVGSTVFVWNPATHKYISLTDRKYCYEDGRLYFGFGFSAAKSDFKVVVFLSATPYYDIYSVQDGLWRRYSLSDDIYQGYTPLAHGCFVNGTIYWIAGSMNDREMFSMLSFDCEREEFKTMELPQELCKFRHLRLLKLFKFSDKLSVLRRGGSFELPLELWVMEDVANNTWNKLFNINNFCMSASLLNHDILVAQDGNMFAAGRDELSSVDLPFESGTLHQPLNGFVFRESLFLTDIKGKSSSSSHKGRQCKDGKIYFGYRFRTSELLNFCLDVAGKLMASA